MKKLVMMMMLAGGSAFMATRTEAQVSIRVNIGNQPAWAPQGYDEAQYYYIPDMDVYYDVPVHQFVYLSNRRWVRSATLPATYGGYDLYKVHKVAINQKDAYRNHDRDEKAYAQFRGKYDQQPIRDSHDNRYNDNRNNWNNGRFANNGKKNGHDKNDRNDKHDKGRGNKQ